MTATAPAPPSQSMIDARERPQGARDRDPVTSVEGLVRVLLVDDHPAVRFGIKRVLEDEYDIMLVASTATAREALTMANASPVDVAVVDFELGGENGLTLARTLSKLPDAPRILIYTAYADVAMTLGAIVAGADGLLSKASFGDELCHVIRTLARGRRHFPAVTRPVAESALARLNQCEQAITGMLIHGLDPTTIAQTLNITDAELDAQRWSILKALTAQPSGDAGLLPSPQRHTLLDYDRPLRQRAGQGVGA